MNIRLLLCFLLALVLLTSGGLSDSAEAESGEDYEIPNGHFFSQTVPGPDGFSVIDDNEARFWSEFDRIGGLQTVGYPISRRYLYDGFVTQAFQKLILQWRPEVGEAWPINVFDELSDSALDDKLFVIRQVPYPLVEFDQRGASFDEVTSNRQDLLAASPEIEDIYFESRAPLTMFGLPTSHVEDMGNHYALRTQRAVFQEWKEDVPWAVAGQVTIANGGDIAKEMGWLKGSMLLPESSSNGLGDLPLFELRLKQVVAERNYSPMQELMGNPFGVGFWRSEGVSYSPAEAIAQLRRNYLNSESKITFPEPQPDLTRLLDGQEPLLMCGPTVKGVRALYSKGWGNDGKAEAILIIASRPDGSYYWYSVLIAPAGF
jgi:hypothetical protein